MSGRAVLSVEGLLLDRGGARVLDVPRLELMAGETLALLGPNGAGKSSLLLCLAGLLRPTAGKVRTRAGDPVDSLAQRRRIAVVFQEPLLLDTTVWRNVASGLDLRRTPLKEKKGRVAESLERFRISHLADRAARTLSGGEAQRVSLARAFALDPEILFLDEPLAALDAPTREALTEDLAANLRQSSAAALLVTHDRGEALRLCDRLAVLREGRVAQLGTPEWVMNRPADPFVAGFVGMETVLSGQVEGVEAGCLAVRVRTREILVAGEAEAGDAVLLGVRPENVTLSPVGGAGTTSARNRFPAHVTRLVPQGVLLKVELDAGFPLSAYVTARSVEELGLAVGERVEASFKATAVHVIRREPAA